MEIVNLLLNPQPEPELLSAWVIFGLVVGFGLLVLSIVLNALKKNLSKAAYKTLRNIKSPLRWSGIGFVLLAWMQYEGVPYLGMKLLTVLLTLGCLIWIGHLCRQYAKTAHRIQRAEERRIKA